MYEQQIDISGDLNIIIDLVKCLKSKTIYVHVQNNILVLYTYSKYI